jgi:outer membrane lipoprotein SlyB
MKKAQIALTALLAVAALGSGDAFAACNECGSVVDVRTVEVKTGEASGGGAVLGGVVGGVIGHQIGSGRGNTAATVLGAVGGAAAGHQIEKNTKTETKYQVVVKMEAGNDRYFNYSQPTSFRVGDKVKIIDKKLVRQ